LSEPHITLSVMFWLEESLKIPVAIKVFCAPIGRVAAAGASDTETIVALLTLNGTEAVLLPRVAVTLIRPGAMPVPIPLLDPIERMVGSEEDQVTWCVMSRVLPSLNVPLAVNCCLVPWAMLPFAGWIAIEVRLAAFTVSSDEPVTPPNAAVMVDVPMLTELSKPLAVILATLVADEVHFATPVMSCTLPSVKVVVAVNCWETPSGSVGVAGVTAMETGDAELTAREVVPLIAPSVAAIIVFPLATAFANPKVGAELLMVAALLFDEDQFTVPVRFCVLLSL
jgi:hypothetical protein